jgi:electron transport complex protein RnfA
MLKDILFIAISAVFVNNFVLVQILGICPFLGVTKKTESALGMGMGVIVVMTLTSAITFPLYGLLQNLGLEFLNTIVFIFVIAGLVQMLEMVLKKVSPSLYSSLGVYLPLITTNCAILGVAIVNLTNAFVTNFFTATLNGLFAGAGFTLALVLLAGLREKLDKNMNIAKPLKGFPITLITASFMAMAFSLFAGLVLS